MRPCASATGSETRSPPRRSPVPPCVLSRCCAAAWTAILLATSLIGGEERQAPLGKLDRLVHYGVHCAVHQVLGELLIRRQVKIRKELLPLVEAVVLLGDRLFDLHDQVRSLEDPVGGLDHTRTA
jgi:hypothetical protein